jgi:PAS domain S-box-containing protein
MTDDLLVCALDGAGEGILVIGASGEIVYANLAFERMTGHQLGRLVGRPAEVALGLDLTPAGVRRDLEATLAKGRVWRGELTGRAKDGSGLSCETSVSRVQAGDGSGCGWVAICRDASAIHDLEARLRQSQKMEAVGRLAGGIAHDFNNLLQVITGYSDELAVGLSSQPALRRTAEAVKAAAGRASALTRQLLAFSRRQVLAPTVLDVNAVVADMTAMLTRLLGGDIRLVVKLSREAARAKVDRNQLEQVVMNLAINARDAMPCGGTVTIATRIEDIGASGASRYAGLEPGRYVGLTVEDTGYGMDGHTIAHLFEPFFTTKGEGQGTGLGLSTSYGIVKQSDGYIYADSTPGKGSVFTVWLPYLEAHVATAGVEPEVQEPPRGNETILVVEDEAEVRGLTCQALRSLGYLVLEAPSGGEGLAAIERRAGRIDLVLTDMMMPGMTGAEMVDRIRRSRPGVRVLIVSGHADAIARAKTCAGLRLLAKPFTPAKLAVAVREALDQEGVSEEIPG